ncbi:MAG: Eco57I restriction-modification methylase domain-containing protein [Sulfuritalea sp.]|nr:Eco57I restriction-modification methylase domain-containing protein [Sulfuritalea sp.]MDP1982249.1 Eco57I restriction-modification methylase domain-containing protein [Sulfuritalea sp.]
MDGKLFSQDFLVDGIKTTPVWEGLSDDVLDVFIDDLKHIYAPLTAASQLNEANTEADIIEKVLDLLGWNGLTLKQLTASSARREDVPDFLLFPHWEAKQSARAEARDDRRYRHGLAILEAKRWMRPLDRGDATNRLDPGTPSNQILRYLSSAEVASDRAVRWGILTNGAVWRLYWQGARSRSEEFLELDLAALLGVPGTGQSLFDVDARHGIKLFFCLFHLGAFLRQTWDKEERTFHEFAFNEARLYEEKVSQDLGARVFASIFPQLAAVLAANDPDANTASAAYLTELREATLILLYRLLFILYAEDRNLLPTRDNRYDDYALRKIREDIARRRDSGDAFSTGASRYWQHLGDLFRIISQGDASIGMPAYNGGLFEENRAPLLTRARVPDAGFAPLLDDLSRRADILRAWINYRDLSVQHLGGIYERLLEYSLTLEDGLIVARPASFARKTSGSYYTHDGLVKLIIRETVGPLVDERLSAFHAQLHAWSKRRELKPDDWKILDKCDPASAILDLKVCDPAMGSGHFLVSLVDYLADEILEAIAAAELEVAAQPWARDIANPWASPLVARVKDIRERILTLAHTHRWTVSEAQLDDRHMVRRMILKRVIFGVDKNPMAVELAKVALWLHTFTVGAPLSFLDHHLHCGDSLFGGKVKQVRDAVSQQGSLIYQDDLRGLNKARDLMLAIGNLTDIDIAEAHHSKAMMDTASDGLRPMKCTLDFLLARQWAGKAARKEYDTAWADLLSNYNGGNLLASVKFYSERKGRLSEPNEQQTLLTMQAALARADAEHFMHWELAFPNVWQDGIGGFDAIIGNPPWDRMKLQEVEWFSERRPQIAKAARATDRKKLIAQLEANHDPLWQDYCVASEAAEIAARIARSGGDYPLLSGGDINLYSLFVERAAALVKPGGLVGLLTPSGIAADKGAAEFFRGLSQTGRLSALYDFENKKAFFPDVHASFKFCVLIFGGSERTFPVTRCAFYLHKLEELDDAGRVLTLSSDDFSAVSPNTGAAPIFRTRRDADITTAIYRRQPVLVNRSAGPVKKVWPLRYCTMFHMTNDSGLFKRRDELEAQGWYPIGMNRWKQGEAEAVPLYEGKMVQSYDHRAASVVMNAENLHRPAQQEASTFAQHIDPNFLPEPQFWVTTDEVRRQYSGGWVLAFKEITAPTNMRSMIACIVPGVGFGNKLPLLLPDSGAENGYAQDAPLLVANLNSFAFDFVVRQKLQGQTLNLFIIEQLPLIRPEQFEQKLGKTRIADFVRGEVLRLSYTAHDLAPFARDLGYQGAPFEWDEDDRHHRLARLDALFFYLYGLSRDDASYILDTFPIVRDQDEKAHGRYLTRELILAYMNAVAAGDFTTVVQA